MVGVGELNGSIGQFSVVAQSFKRHVLVGIIVWLHGDICSCDEFLQINKQILHLVIDVNARTSGGIPNKRTLLLFLVT